DAFFGAQRLVVRPHGVDGEVPGNAGPDRLGAVTGADGVAEVVPLVADLDVAAGSLSGPWAGHALIVACVPTFVHLGSPCIVFVPTIMITSTQKRATGHENGEHDMRNIKANTSTARRVVCA